MVSVELEVRQSRVSGGFYFGLSLYMLALMTLGFWPSYFALLIGDAAGKPPFVHVHAVVFVSWMLLFVAQTALVAVRRVSWHRQLGQIGIAWGFLVLAVGVVTTALAFVGRIEQRGIDVASAFLIWPLSDMIIFAAFFVPAVLFRAQPGRHKRFMLVAVTNLLVAAVGRVVALDTAVEHAMNVLIWVSPILLAMIYDCVTRRTVHGIYVLGVSVLVVSSFRDLVGDTNAWFRFSEWLAAFLI